MPGLNTYGLNAPAIGDAGSGYAPLGTVYGLQEPLELANSTCIIGTDNGFIIKRDGPNHFKVVYADSYDPATDNPTNTYSGIDQGVGPHSYRSLQCEHIEIAWNNPNHIIVHVEDEYASDWGGYVYSDDRGESFQRSHPVGGYGPIFYTFGDSLGSEGFMMDEDGYIWAYSIGEFSVPKEDWHKAIEGDTWVRQFAGDNALATSKTHWIGDGYIWGIALNQPAITPLVLHRQAITGGTIVNTTIVKPGSASFGFPAALWGRHGTGRLVGWAPRLNQQAGPSGWPILSIDIRNPFAPTYQWTATGLPTTGYIVQMMLPLRNDVVVCNTLNSASSNDGALWYSGDGGLTWIKTVAETTRLGLQSPGTGFGIDRLSEDNQRIASPPEMPWEVWAATKPPYVYHSRDMGATWEIETVDMSIFDGYLGRLPTVWNSIGALPDGVEGPNLVTTA